MNDDQWFQEHTAYLKTEEWQARRKNVIERDKGLCQARFDVCTVRAEQVHHLTYRHWREEPLFDLVAVCALCHEKLTALDRGETPVTPADVENAKQEWATRVMRGEQWVPPARVLLLQRLAREREERSQPVETTGEGRT